MMSGDTVCSFGWTKIRAGRRISGEEWGEAANSGGEGHNVVV
jgi:hypothetical protein